MSHKVNEGGPEKENTIKISIFERESIAISKRVDKKTKFLVQV
jgi:hypothetical protein